MIKFLQDGEITNSIAKKILPQITLENKSLDSLIQKMGPTAYLPDEGLLILVKKIIKENPEIVNKYLNGKTAVLKSLIGLGMRESKGRADPKRLEKELEEFLKSYK